jgi:hypothetical protein
MPRQVQDCAYGGNLGKEPRALFPDNLFEGVVEDAVEDGVGDRGQHPEEEREGVADGSEDGLLRKNFRPGQKILTTILMRIF